MGQLFPLKFGLATLKRLLQVMEDMEKGCKDIFPSSNKSEYVRLERMVVHPDFQGKGLGTKCLQNVIKKTEVPIHLMTQEQRNVTFYNRSGFRVLGQRDMSSQNDNEDKRFMFTSWFMICE